MSCIRGATAPQVEIPSPRGADPPIDQQRMSQEAGQQEGYSEQLETERKRLASAASHRWAFTKLKEAHNSLFTEEEALPSSSVMGQADGWAQIVSSR